MNELLSLSLSLFDFNLHMVVTGFAIIDIYIYLAYTICIKHTQHVLRLSTVTSNAFLPKPTIGQNHNNSVISGALSFSQSWAFSYLQPLILYHYVHSSG